MRRVNRWVAAVFPLVLAASACSRSGERKVVEPAPELPDAPEIVGARWVWEQEALAAAVSRAGRSPAVQRALREAPVAGLTPAFQHVVRAVGATSAGAPLALTILPYAVEGDPMRAAFISLAEAPGQEGVELAEMIVGREPLETEVGFIATTWGDRRVWIRTAESVAGPAGIDRAGLRRKFAKLFQCLAERMPAGCASGAAIADEIAPGVPRAAAIGCAAGGALAAVACVADWLGGK